MTVHDFLIIAILCGFAVWGFVRGFLRELGGLLGLVVGWLLAARFAAGAGSRLLPDAWPLLVKAILCAVVIVVVSLLSFKIIFSLLRKLVVHGPLKPLDRVTGSAFGLIKGAAVVVLLLALALVSPYRHRLEKRAADAPVLMRAMAVTKPLARRYKDKFVAVVTLNLLKSDAKGGKALEPKIRKEIVSAIGRLASGRNPEEADRALRELSPEARERLRALALKIRRGQGGEKPADLEFLAEQLDLERLASRSPY